MDIITKRLSRDTSYKKPEQTYQETLTDTQIAEKLIDYSRTKGDDIFNIPIGTHIRYFAIDQKTGEKQFRLGGKITKFGDNKKYIVCSNGQYSWSIQLANSIIYKKLSTEEVKEKVKKNVIKDTENEMDKIKEENKEIKKIIKQIKDTTIKNKKN
jgi:hypothetical protein